MHDTKQADEGTKWHFLVQLAKYNYMMLTKKERIYLAESVGRRESYLCGYKTPFSARTLMRWWTEHETNHQYSVEIQDMFKSKSRKKRRTYLGSIQIQYPSFLHQLYRYASKTLGHNTSNYRIRKLMMEKAKLDFPNCTVRGNLMITAYAFRSFFNCNREYYTKLSSKPRLTKCQIKERVKFCTKYKELIKDKEYYYCFLDEKWFYCSTLRKKYKILPPNYKIGETMKDAYVPLPRVRSRRHPCKVMYLGIVSPPHPNHNFDGKVFFKRVSKFVPQKQQSHSSTVFSDDYKLNDIIRNHEDWKSIYTEGMPTYALFDSIQEMYELEDYITTRLVLTYTTYSKSLKTKYIRHIDYDDGLKEEKLQENEEECSENQYVPPSTKDILSSHILTVEGEYRKLQLRDLTLQVRTRKGQKVSKDTTCDTKFMMSIVDNGVYRYFEK